MRLRDSDRRLALTVRGTGWLWHPTALSEFTFTLWDKLLREDKVRQGIRYYEAQGRLSPWAAATAIGKRLIRFDPGYLDRPAMQRVSGQTHEHRHCQEYRYHDAFRLKYVFDRRFTWAVECQGVAAELWCMKAQTARKENMISRVERLIKSFTTPWVDGGYNCQNIANVEKETFDILMEVIDA
jgi:hypothetical protein